MTVLPIVERELRVASRRWRTYWSRVGAAGSALAVAAFMMGTMAGELGTVRAGQALFLTLAWVLFLACLLVGVRTTADAISQEKRDGTLGFLFLTDLKSVDIVLGKLAAHSVNALYGLVAAVPILAIPLLMGGLRAKEFWLTVLVLFNTLIASLAAGLFASSVSHRERHAAGFTLLLALGLSMGLPVLGVFLPWALDWNQPIQWLLVLTPAAGLVTLMQQITMPRGFGMAVPWSEIFWGSVGFTVAASVVFLLLALWFTPRTWRDKATTSAKPRTLRGFWEQWIYGNPARRLAHRRHLLQLNPVHWLCSRGLRRPWGTWLLLLGIAGCWFYGYAKIGRSMLDDGATIFMLVATHIILKLWMGSTAVTFFAAQRQQSSLELLLTTPLTEREVLSGQWLALRRHFLGPILAVLAVDLIPFFSISLVSWEQEDVRIGTVLATSWVLQSLADFVAIGWVGMWQGLVAKNIRSATSGTITRVLVLPWLALAFFSMLANLSEMRELMHSIAQALGPYVVFGLWTAIFVAIDWLWIRHARRVLHQRMRTVAAMRYGGEKPATLWGRLGRVYGRLRPQTQVHPAP